MLTLALHTVWFTFLVLALEVVTETPTPIWVIASMAFMYVAILAYDEDLIGKTKEALRWVRNKFSSVR